MNRIVVFTAALVCAVGALLGSRLLGVKSRPVEAPPATSAPQPDSANPGGRAGTIDAQLRGRAELQRQLEDLRNQLARLRTGDGAGGEAKKERFQPDDLTPEQRANVEHIWTEQFSAQLDLAFQREPVDGTWSAAAATSAQRALQSAVAASSTLAVDCRSSLCRAEIDHHDPDGARKLKEKAIGGLGWEGPTFGHSVKQGERQRTVVYLFKPGTAMPAPELTAQDVLAGL